MATDDNQANDDQQESAQQSQGQQTTTTNPYDNIAKAYNGNDVPGRRPKNPLSSFASVNYQVSLYMLTPDAYNTFILSGRQNINAFNAALAQQNIGPATGLAQNEGVFLIAQNGGINNSTNARANGFELDFYIDNLYITTATPVAGTASTAGTYNIKFQIIEPYGFSFITALKQTSEQMQLAQGVSGPNNPVKNLFVLGIRFIGYDINGAVLTGQETFNDATLDPLGIGNGIFERYLDFTIYSFKFKLDGKAVRYDIEGQVISSDAYKTKRGFAHEYVTLQADTVENALKGENGLEKSLNKQQELLFQQGKIQEKTNYKFEFAPDSEEIAQALLVNPEDNDPYILNRNASGARSTDEANERIGFATTVVPTVKNIKVPPETRIQEIVEGVIKYSSYMTSALKELYKNNPQSNPNFKDFELLSSGQRANISWFTLNAEFTNARYDSIQQDWIFDITYIIQKYDTPYVLSPYANPGKRYYGPHKVYNYWFTGQNTEVLKYEQEFNNAYFLNVVAAPDSNFHSNTPVLVGGAPSDGTRIGDLTSRPSEPVNNYTTTLYDPTGMVNATLEIMGDPDYLSAPSSSSINKLFNKFYGADGFTISGSGGQVFIEIIFKEAVDYDEKSGLLLINDQISFYSNPWNKNAQTQFIRGLVYQVRSVEHKFVQGKFTQTLSLQYADPARLQLEDVTDQGRTPEQQSTETTGNGSSPTATGGAVGDTGQRPPADAAVTDQNRTNINPNPNSPITGSANTRRDTGTNQGIADDDSVPANFTGTTYADNNYDYGSRDIVGLGGNPFGRGGILGNDIGP
jgi:hypothetical protein